MLAQRSSITAFHAHPDDTVATLLSNATAGPLEIRHSDGTRSTTIVAEDIERGHKVAISNMSAGTPVIKYGIVIGTAARDIIAGDWVHLHNCRSAFDERSASLDVRTGAPTDTKYG